MWFFHIPDEIYQGEILKINSNDYPHPGGIDMARLKPIFDTTPNPIKVFMVFTFMHIE